MDIEDRLRSGLAERAGAVRTSPDEVDLARRVRKAERARQRVQHGAAAAALVVVAASSGVVLGAFVDRPGSQPSIALQKTDDTVGSVSIAGRSPTTTTTKSPAGAATTTTTVTPGPTTTTIQPGTAGSTGATSPLQAAADAQSSRHVATLDGLAVEWLVTPLASPVAVLAADGSISACLDARVVSVTIGSGTPFAGGSGVVGLPQLDPQGLAVVASGSFGAPGRPAGWWAIVDAGSSASHVAVQFPSGAVVREQVGGSGVAVLAALAPRGSDLDTSVYASAVADSPSQVTSSLEFLVGGPLAVVDPAGDSSPGASRSTSGGGAGGSSQAGSTGFASCMSTSFLAPLSPQSAGSAGPPAPLVAAGDVVGAFEQAYDVNPLLGLAWNFSAVDLGSQLGCPVESISGLGSASASHADGLAVPQVEVQAVEFSGPASAVVVYQRGDGLLETGTATIADGTWKVSRSTYCRDIGSQ